MNDGSHINRLLGVVDNGATRTQDPYPRFVARNGQPSIRRVGLKRRRFGDGYHWLMTLSWSRFLLLWVGVYLGVIALFAVLYWLQPGGVAQARPGVLLDDFFLSVQTLGTIGYGDMWPKTIYANVLVTVEAFASLALTAVGTGLIFSRVSRPTARVMFSRCAVVTPLNGQLNLMFRAGAARVQPGGGGVPGLRRLEDRARPLAPVRPDLDHHARHRRGESAARRDTRVIGGRGGGDRHRAVRGGRHLRPTDPRTPSYLPHEIVWGRRMADIILQDESGARYVDYGRFHDLVEEMAMEAPG